MGGARSTWADRCPARSSSSSSSPKPGVPGPSHPSHGWALGPGPQLGEVVPWEQSLSPGKGFGGGSGGGPEVAGLISELPSAT